MNRHGLVSGHMVSCRIESRVTRCKILCHDSPSWDHIDLTFSSVVVFMKLHDR